MLSLVFELFYRHDENNNDNQNSIMCGMRVLIKTLMNLNWGSDSVYQTPLFLLHKNRIREDTST